MVEGGQFVKSGQFVESGRLVEGDYNYLTFLLMSSRSLRTLLRMILQFPIFQRVGRYMSRDVDSTTKCSVREERDTREVH